jgi:hypothetical protein
MDATLDEFDWDSLHRRFLPPALRDLGVMPLRTDRGPAVRTVLSALSRRSGSGDGRGGPEPRLDERLAALMAWARVDVPVAVLAGGHTHAQDLIGAGAARYQRSDALWTVWLSEGSGLTASAGGPVYRLNGVASRPLGGRTTTHAVVAAESPDGTMLFAVDLRHPRVHVMADVAAAESSPVEYSGAFRFESVPVTPLARPMPPQHRLRRDVQLSSSALVVGAVAGLADEVADVSAGPVTEGRERLEVREAVAGLAARVLAAARTVDSMATGLSSPGFDAEIACLGADIRSTAADVLELGGRVDGHPGSPIAERVLQLGLALRLGARVV